MKKLTILILFVFTLCFISTASAQWVDQPAPTDQYIQDIFFLNDNTGWMCGKYNDLFASGSVYKTTNGGANWITNGTNFSGALTDMHFFDANTGIVTGRYTFKTTNGGDNWTQLTMAIGAINGGMYFINNSTGWVCGLIGTIQKTTNGGTNWIQQTPGLTSDALESAFFINSSTGWIAGYDGNILKTTNGGTNWQLQSAGSGLHQMYFVDANTGIVVGNNSYRTTNGGTSWVAIPEFAGKYNSCISFATSLAGWVSGDDGIFFTSDGGASWLTQVNTFSPYFDVVSALSSGTVYLAGEVMRKTTTGGFNLTAPSNLTLTPSTTSAIDLSWTDNSSQEDKFMIERSTDGSNWALIDSVNAGVTTYQSTGLGYNSDYYYRVYTKKVFIAGGKSNEPRGRAKLDAPANSSPSDNSIVTNTTPTFSWGSVSGGFTYNFQVATDAAFTNIVYTSGSSALTSQAIPPGILQNSTRYYWRSKAQNIITYSDNSTATSFAVMDPNYGNTIQAGSNLYYYANSTAGANLSPSKPTYEWRDTTGSTYMIRNGALTRAMIAGNLDDGLFRFTNIISGSNAIRFFGNNYQTIYIGTNGIISFGQFDPQLGVNIEPFLGGLANNTMLNAILPLWKDFNFGDADVTGRTLCIKVTSNEIIITFSKVPSYNAATDANDYVSFQAIIGYTSDPTQNSKIDYMYNYNETGSSFITKYNNNTIYPMLVGIKGVSGSAQEFQYRFFNSNLQLISSGPIFGSNLALALGPDASLLPVELASFTSSVNGNNTELEWSTVSELNNSGFEIQRTIASENNWKKISFVQGNGTTNQAKNYSYIDNNLESGKYQYRLKQIDFNGNYEYFNLSNEIEIGVPKKFSLSQNYPNPFNPATKINFELPRSSKVKLSVFDVAGKLVSEIFNGEKAAGYYTVEFNGANLASGMYFYQIQTEDFTAVKKMILIK